jgi:hypothetical protein
MKALQTFLILASFLFLFSTGAVSAKTPDGMTPSEESVCDIYNDKLYGLCVAYCEAMDCGDPYQRATNQACESVEKNFMKKSGGQLPACAALEQ